MDTPFAPQAAALDPRTATCTTRAVAFDRRHANRRAVFGMVHSLAPGPNGTWSLSRRWTGVADDVVCEELVHWHPQDGLLDSASASPSMGERLEARRAPGTGHDTPVFNTCRVPNFGAPATERRLALPCRGFTLASAPLEIAAAWPALLRGERLRRQYLVLKVQRHAAVDVRAIRISDQAVAVALTPVALPLRWLFGRTVFHFHRKSIGLHAVDGLLDPRDRKRNGRWHEYLGRLEFSTPVSFASIAANGATTEVTP